MRTTMYNTSGELHQAWTEDVLKLEARITELERENESLRVRRERLEAPVSEEEVQVAITALMDKWEKSNDGYRRSSIGVEAAKRDEELVRVALVAAHAARAPTGEADGK